MDRVCQGDFCTSLQYVAIIYNLCVTSTGLWLPVLLYMVTQSAHVGIAQIWVGLTQTTHRNNGLFSISNRRFLGLVLRGTHDSILDILGTPLYAMDSAMDRSRVTSDTVD